MPQSVLQPIRGREVSILPLSAQIGAHPAIRSLNPSFRPNVPLLKLRLRIEWSPPAPGPALAELEQRLLNLSSSFRRHQCRGGEQYRVFRDDRSGEGAGRLEAELALAHLIEHMMIDVLSFITGARRVSGATGAPRDARRAYDLFVECPDPMVAPLAIHLSLSWIVALVEGQALDGGGKPTLELARHLYRNRFGVLQAEVVSRELGRPPDEVRDALERLEEGGFACRVPYSMNFSGGLYYRLCPPARRERLSPPAEPLPAEDGHRF